MPCDLAAERLSALNPRLNCGRKGFVWGVARLFPVPCRLRDTFRTQATAVVGDSWSVFFCLFAAFSLRVFESPVCFMVVNSRGYTAATRGPPHPVSSGSQNRPKSRCNYWGLVLEVLPHSHGFLWEATLLPALRKRALRKMPNLCPPPPPRSRTVWRADPDDENENEPKRERKDPDGVYSECRLVILDSVTAVISPLLGGVKNPAGKGPRPEQSRPPPAACPRWCPCVFDLSVCASSLFSLRALKSV